MFGYKDRGMCISQVSLGFLVLFSDIASISCQAQAKSRKLEGVVKQLDDLIRKGDELLSQMLPKTIAAEIRAGKNQSDLTSVRIFSCKLNLI